MKDSPIQDCVYFGRSSWGSARLLLSRHARQVQSQRKSDDHRNLGLSANPEVIPKAVDLMHTLVQDCHDPDIATREMAPIDAMVLITKEDALDAEFGRNGS